MKKKLLFTGIVAVASPIPMIIITVLWSWIIFFGVGMGLLGYFTVPNWISCLCLLPLSFSPLFGIFGITLGLIKIKERHSLLCIILSVLGLLINFALIFGMDYIGSRC